MQPGLFAQLVIGPLFTKYRILSQVAGHNMAVLKVLPPLVATDEDIDYFVTSLRASIRKAQHVPTSLMKLGLSAVGVR